MKIDHRQDGDALHIRIRGAVEGDKCDCLQHFWDRYVTGNLASLTVDLGSIDDVDSSGIAVMVDCLRNALADGAAIELLSPPQMLAHTLYKAGMLDNTTLLLTNPRDEEPYAG